MRIPKLRRIQLLAILLLSTTSIMASHAFASTVLKVTLPQVAQSAQLIFEGNVISKQVRYAPNGDPFTYFTFLVIDVVKGFYPSPTIELGYMGGTNAEGITMQITDMRMPEIGEHGIYFVESLTRQQVHPLFGWQQGHFLVIPPQTGMPARVVPVDTPSGAMLNAPSLIQFKQQIRTLTGNVQ